jgi:hypothetical protein
LNKNGIGDGDEDEDVVVDDEGVMPCPPMIRVASWMMSSPKFLLQIYLRGGFSVFSGRCVC